MVNKKKSTTKLMEIGTGMRRGGETLLFPDKRRGVKN